MTHLRTLLPHPLLSAALVGIWLWLNDSLAPGQVVLGGVLALGIPLLTRPFWSNPVAVRVSRVPGFLVLLIYDIVVANLQVARLILGPLAHLRSGFIRVPLDLHTDYATTILASTISLTPGTVTVDILDMGDGQRALLVHYLSNEDPQALALRIKQRYETRIRRIFEC